MEAQRNWLGFLLFLSLLSNVTAMDYSGQRLSENIHYVIVVLFGTVAWFYGYYVTDFEQTFYGWAIGLGLSLIICIPDWPFYNRNKVQWLDEIPEYSSDMKKSIFKKTVKAN